MNARKTKAGTWHITAYVGKVNGKKVYKSITADTKRDCELKATEYINHHPIDGSDLTVRQALFNYVESKEHVLSPSTIREYRRKLEHTYDDINDMRVEDLTSYDLQKFVSSIRKNPKTVRDIYGLLSAALNMHTDKRFSVTLPSKIEPTRTVASEDDINQLLDAAPGTMKQAILLGACSLRRGEVAALKYEDIISDSAIYIHADMVINSDNKWVYKEWAKTDSSTRIVDIDPTIIKALGAGTGYIVDKTPNAITQSFTKLRNRLGINISFHSLRRFYASISHALGIPDKYIQKQGGWSSDTVMKKSYQHTLDKQEQEFQSKFNEKLSSLWS